MVEVFKTNVQKKGEAKTLLLKLIQLFPKNKINFDLNDCDKILRVQGKDISVKKIIQLHEQRKLFMQSFGIKDSILNTILRNKI